jgi:hypothetical protein
MDDKVGERRIKDAGGIELFAGDGGADDGENAGTNDCADAESGERPRPKCLFEGMLGFFRVADQLIDGFAGKQLAWQRSSPRLGVNTGARSRCNVFRKKMSVPEEDVFPECGKAYAAVYMMGLKWKRGNYECRNVSEIETDCSSKG